MYGIKEIDAAELSKQLSSTTENLPLHVIPLKVEELDTDETIVFYCQTGTRSAQACAFMTSKGVDNCYNLRGWGLLPGCRWGCR